MKKEIVDYLESQANSLVYCSWALFIERLTDVPIEHLSSCLFFLQKDTSIFYSFPIAKLCFDHRNDFEDFKVDFLTSEVQSFYKAIKNINLRGTFSVKQDDWETTQRKVCHSNENSIDEINIAIANHQNGELFAIKDIYVNRTDFCEDTHVQAVAFLFGEGNLFCNFGCGRFYTEEPLKGLSKMQRKMKLLAEDI